MGSFNDFYFENMVEINMFLPRIAFNCICLQSRLDGNHRQALAGLTIQSLV
jgi:hypothetical protein